MVELRKRKTPPPAPVRPAKKVAAPRRKKAAAADKTVVEKAAEVASETVEAVTEAVSEAVEAVKEAVTSTDSANGSANANANAAPVAEAVGAPKVGDTIDLATFGGQIETHDGTKTTLKQLVEASKGGVVLFTYPKASTPGCKFAPAPTTPLHILTRRRHHPGLSLPRLVHAPHCYGLRHLWPLQ
jgi:peroxiredoxin Q/BCP